jgi:uncharacterized protein (TIGR00255 family)
MLYSMTGFGAAACKEENISVSVELKAVNNRHFKLSLRMTDGYSALEQRVEPLIRTVIERGTINAHVRIVGARNDSGYQINTAVLQAYMKQLSDVAAIFERSSSYDTTLDRFALLPSVIALPGVVSIENDNNDEADNEKIGLLLEKAIREALDALQTMRKTEGESMAKDLTANIESLRQLIGNITELAPRIAPLYRQKLKERIEKAMAEQGLSLGDADFVRELAVYADRCDISEELVRFQSHLEQFTQVMQSKESCGRKLDFLTQELFREVNTVGSKANDADITKCVVEIKTVIERIREMVQNVE